MSSSSIPSTPGEYQASRLNEIDSLKEQIKFLQKELAWLQHMEGTPQETTSYPDTLPSNVVMLPDRSSEDDFLTLFFNALEDILRKKEAEHFQTECRSFPSNVFSLPDRIQMIDGGLVPA